MEFTRDSELTSRFLILALLKIEFDNICAWSRKKFRDSERRSKLNNILLLSIVDPI